MRILLGISILVLVAILWTTFCIVRHISVTRRRNRFLREQLPDEEMQILQPLPSISNIAPLPARFAAPIMLTAEPKEVEPEQKIARAIPESRSVSKPSRDRPQLQLRPETGLLARVSTVENQPLRILEFVPDPAPAQDNPYARRPVRSAHPQPSANETLPAHRSDWIYFNKDMGDLSDPLPGRIRDRVRSR